MIIIGIIMYVFGSIGNLLNICVFAQWSYSYRRGNNDNSLNRKGNTSLYLLTTSTANLIVIIYPLCIRIYIDGFGHLITEENSFILCQLRYYVLQTFLIISLICTCIATFDRYLMTSRSVRLRQWSASRQSTIKIIIFIVLLSALHSIPTALYHDRSEMGDCIIISRIYFNYYIYFVVVCLYGAFPIIFLLIFGRLTYKQMQILKRTNRSENSIMEKQISQMVLYQCVALICSYIPFCIQQIHFEESIGQKAFLSSFNLFFRITTMILFYVNPAASFYIFFFSTPNFRHQIKKIMLCKQQHKMINNQIHVINQTTDRD